MKTVIVLFNDLLTYTIESEFPEQLVRAYASIGIEAFEMPVFLIEQAF